MVMAKTVIYCILLSRYRNKQASCNKRLDFWIMWLVEAVCKKNMNKTDLIYVTAMHFMGLRSLQQGMIPRQEVKGGGGVYERQTVPEHWYSLSVTHCFGHFRAIMEAVNLSRDEKKSAELLSKWFAYSLSAQCSVSIGRGVSFADNCLSASLLEVTLLCASLSPNAIPPSPLPLPPPSPPPPPELPT